MSEFVCTVGELRWALANTIPFASIDETRPYLCGLHLAVADDTLTVTATDTYKLIEHRVVAEAPVGSEFDAIIPLDDAKAVLASAKAIPVPKDDDQAEMFPREASISVGEQKVTVVLDRMLDSIRHAIVPVEGSYPDVASLWPTAPEPTEVLSLYFRGGAEMAKLGKVIDPDFPKRRTPAVLTLHGSIKPVVFTMGERVRGMFVPAKMDSKGMEG